MKKLLQTLVITNLLFTSFLGAGNRFDKLPLPRLNCLGSGQLVLKSKCDMIFSKYLGLNTLDQSMGQAAYNMSSDFQARGYEFKYANVVTTSPFAGRNPLPGSADEFTYVEGIGQIYLPIRAAMDFEMTENYVKTINTKFMTSSQTIVIKYKGKILRNLNGSTSIKLSKVDSEERPWVRMPVRPLPPVINPVPMPIVPVPIQK